MSALDFAFDVARAGFRTCFTHTVIDGACSCGNKGCPERSWGKHPIAKAWQRVATSDVEQLKAQYDGLRFAPNVSIVLGPQDDGRYLVSIDNDDAQRMSRLLAELGPLPDTMSGKAPRGVRLFFVLPPDTPTDRVKNITGIGGEPGVDLKAAGGQVVVCGRNAVGAYTDFDPAHSIAPLPASWVLAILDKPKPHPKAHEYTPHTLKEDARQKKRFEKYFERAVLSECSLLARANEGMRNTSVLTSGIRLFSLANGMHLPSGWSYVRSELNRAAQACGLSEKESRDVVSNAERYVEREGHVRMPREAPPLSSSASTASFSVESVGPKLIDDNGSPAKIAENVARMLAAHPKGQPRLNMLSGKAEWPDGSVITDADEMELQGWLVAQPYDQRVRVGVEAVHGGIMLAAERNKHEPVQSYLGSLTWDGTPRLASFAETYLGSDSSDYAASVVRCFFVGAVARAMAPGCQMDTMLILEGEQGARKSSLLRALASGAWFSSSQITIGKEPDCYQKLNGVWLYELGEVDDQLGDPKRQQQIKAYLTDRVDHYRPSYGRNVVSRPRRNVFVGTTNQRGYLVDSTGARRHHGLLCGEIDLAAVERDRDQLWAEATHIYRQGVPWWLDAVEEGVAKTHAAERYTADPWEDRVRTFLEPREETTVGDILDAMGVERGRQDRSHATRVGIIVRRIGGWAKVDTRRPERRFVLRRLTREEAEAAEARRAWLTSPKGLRT